jgi:hypothetical protein
VLLKSHTYRPILGTFDVTSLLQMPVVQNFWSFQSLALVFVFHVKVSNWLLQHDISWEQSDEHVERNSHEISVFLLVFKNTNYIIPIEVHYVDGVIKLNTFWKHLFALYPGIPEIWSGKVNIFHCLGLNVWVSGFCCDWYNYIVTWKPWLYRTIVPWQLLLMYEPINPEVLYGNIIPVWHKNTQMKQCMYPIKLSINQASLLQARNRHLALFIGPSCMLYLSLCCCILNLRPHTSDN